MFDEYVEVETIPKQPPKEIKPVRFKTDYDITDVLRRFGNWARKDAYLKQQTPHLFETQQKRFKEVCSDNDAEIINEAILMLLAWNIPSSKDKYDIIIDFYFGEKKKIEDYIPSTRIARECYKKHELGLLCMTSAKDFSKKEIFTIKPLTVQDIAKKLQMSWDCADKLKKSAEDFLAGYFALLEKSGRKLDMLKINSFLKSA